MAPSTIKHPAGSTWPGWLFLAALLFIGALTLRFSSPLFGSDAELADMPIVAFVAIYCATGMIAAFALPRLIKSSSALHGRSLLIFIVLTGAVMRLVQFGAEPLLEDDYNRYLWDGAVTASGHNPYARTPNSVAEKGQIPAELQALQKRAGPVFDAINYPEYSTVYPPVAQAAFAFAYLVKPFSLESWRALGFLLELAILAFIVLILLKLELSPLWCALYWWNPVVIKELANSVHMEPVLMLPVVAALWLTLKAKPVWSSLLLAGAAGAKLWPILLTAAIGRQLLGRPKILLASVCAAGTVLALCAWPVLQAGLSSESGFVAYAQSWRASSGAYLVAEWLASLAPDGSIETGLWARMILAAVLLGAVAVICRSAAETQRQAVHQMFLIAAAIYLLSPSQFPWYFVWIAPFLCIFPVRGLLLAGALLPLHYLYFHFAAQDLEDIYRSIVVWFIWGPVWTLLAVDAFQAIRSHSAVRQGAYAP